MWCRTARELVAYKIQVVPLDYFGHLVRVADSCHSQRVRSSLEVGANMFPLFSTLWSDDRGQDIAEYAVMLAVILVLVVGTIQLIGSNASNVFSQVASTIQ